MNIDTQGPTQATRERRIAISFRTMLLVVATIAGCWLVLHLLAILLVIVVALFLVGTLNPAVEWLERHRLKRSTGIALVFVAMLITAALISLLTVPALIDQVQMMRSVGGRRITQEAAVYQLRVESCG